MPKLVFPNLWEELNPLRKFLGDIFNMLVLSGLAALVMLIAPLATKRASQSLSKNPFLAGLFGLLSLIIFPFAMILLLITLILIPAIPILILASVILLIWGWIGLGVEVGRRAQDIFKLRWADPLIAALGVFTITLLVNMLGWLSSCCLEFPVTVLLVSVGLGGILLSRFGTREYLQ